MPDITIEGPDGSFGAYLAVPDATPAPGIVVAQEIFGVNQVMRDICDWLAGEGYVACCPDIFWRIEPGIQLTDQTDAEWARAFELFGLFDGHRYQRGLDVVPQGTPTNNSDAGRSGVSLDAPDVDALFDLAERPGPGLTRALVEADRERRVDAAYSIFSMMCIELWCRMFVDQPRPSAG